MTQLLVEENGIWNTLLDTGNVAALDMDFYIYSRFEVSRLHSAGTRFFTLSRVLQSGSPTARGVFAGLSVWARIGVGGTSSAPGSNTVSYGSAASEYRNRSAFDPAGDAAPFARHNFPSSSVPPGDSFFITTNYPVPTTLPPFYFLAVAFWN